MRDFGGASALLAVTLILLGLLVVRRTKVLRQAFPAVALQPAEVISPVEAIHHVGRRAQVCGVVASAHFAADSRGSPTFLNLDAPYANQIFTAVCSRSRSSLSRGSPPVAGRRSRRGSSPRPILTDCAAKELASAKTSAARLGWPLLHGNPDYNSGNAADYESVIAVVADQPTRRRFSLRAHTREYFRPVKERAVRLSGIHRRNLDFGLSPDLPRYWHSGDPYITHFFNGLSLMFPEGERFFMDTVQYFQHRITDPKLREDVRGFLGQEAIHGREHRRYNEILAVQGYPTEAIEGCVRRGIQIAWLFPPKWQLALTCALEHFTAVFTDSVLRDPRMLRDAHPAFARLWRWHALEEIEHKSVAYDVYQTIAPGLGGYLRRVVVMLYTTVGFAAQILVHQNWLLHHDGMLWRVRARRRARRYFWKDPGLLRRGLRHYLSYYRCDFHPRELDNSDLVERWKSDYAT